MKSCSKHINSSNSALESLIIDSIRDYQGEPVNLHVPAANGHLRPRIYASDLNLSSVEELTSAPTTAEFARFVQRNRPVVLRKYGFHPSNRCGAALAKWSASYLREKLGSERKLKIAATPYGNADSLVDGMFVEPACECQARRCVISNQRLIEGADMNERHQTWTWTCTLSLTRLSSLSQIESSTFSLKMTICITKCGTFCKMLAKTFPSLQKCSDTCQMQQMSG